MTNKIVLAACGLFLGASAASAASVGYTEGFRGLVDDTTQIGFGEANDSDSPFMLTDPALSAGDSVELYGMIRGDADHYSIQSGEDFDLSFLFGGYSYSSDFSGPGSSDTSGLQFGSSNAGDMIELKLFSQDDGTGALTEVFAKTYSNSVISAADAGGASLIFHATAGSYVLVVSATSDASATYDLRVDAQSVAEAPLPAALPLLVASLAGLGFVSRRRVR